MQGRLTLTSGVAETTADVSGALWAHYTPFAGQMVPLFDGADFLWKNIGGELVNVASDAATNKAGPAAVAADSAYYWMIWNDAGTPRLTRSPAWASDTDPGPAELEPLGGWWLNKYAITNGPAARRGTIIGGFRSNAAAQLVDTAGFRWVSNIYNARPRPLRMAETGGSWDYATPTWRPSAGNAANKVDWFHALNAGFVDVSILATARSDTAGTTPLVGIGFDGADPSNSETMGCAPSVTAATRNIALHATARRALGHGRHYATWCEYVTNGGTATYLSGTVSGLYQSAIHGEVWN
jgi:hypothetical protein